MLKRSSPSTCICCGQPLDDPFSREVGIGPVCRAKKKLREYHDTNGNLFNQATRADYSFTVENRVVCIVDHGSGRSVTSDADAVIQHVIRDLGVTFPGTVIYRDENRVWDQMIVRAFRFAEFRSLSTYDREEAIVRAQSTRRSPKRNIDRSRRSMARSPSELEGDLFNAPGKVLTRLG